MSLSISYSFSPTTTIESSQVKQNFTDIVSYINNTACVTGMAVIWTGAIVNIPTGWALDTNSRDKFIIGAGNLYAVGASGGAATHTLSSNEMPIHTHIQNSHTHSAFVQWGTSTSNRRPETGEGNYAGTGASTGNVGSTTPTNQDTGGGTAHNNLPPFYAYAIIKKS